MADQYEENTKSLKFNNILPIWGNDSMNLNPLILANIQSSSYFKVSLFKLKTYHEVIDEIYYQVKHMEPWEKGRKTSGQTGMCGGVRGVGAGGIVSSAYCLLYKLYTLRLTRKQLNGLLTHTDSPYIRALGFMYIRYCQPPGDLFEWYEQYLQDEEEIDVKAGGGQVMTIGRMLIQWMTKLEWFTTLFPRIPVPMQKQLDIKLTEYAREYGVSLECPNNASSMDQKQKQHHQRQQQQQQYQVKEARYSGGGNTSSSSSSYRRHDGAASPMRNENRDKQRSSQYHDSSDRSRSRSPRSRYNSTPSHNADRRDGNRATERDRGDQYHKSRKYY